MVVFDVLVIFEVVLGFDCCLILFWIDVEIFLPAPGATSPPQGGPSSPARLMWLVVEAMRQQDFVCAVIFYLNGSKLISLFVFV